jgi:hypothetical protein
MTCDVAEQNASTMVADDEEAVKRGKGDRRHREEIHCRDGFPMVTQKSEPTLGWIGVCGGSTTVSRWMKRVESRTPGAENTPVTNGAFMNFRGPQALKDMDEFRSEEQVLEFWQGIGLVTIVVLRKLSPVQVQESHTPDTS